MVNLTHNTTTRKVRITPSEYAVVFSTLEDFTRYVDDIRTGVVYLKDYRGKVAEVTTTSSHILSYIEIVPPVGYASPQHPLWLLGYKILNTPIIHPIYGKVAVWGVWVHH